MDVNKFYCNLSNEFKEAFRVYSCQQANSLTVVILCLIDIF